MVDFTLDGWVYLADADDVYAAIRDGKITARQFQEWVERKYDAGYDSGRGDGADYGYNEG